MSNGWFFLVKQSVFIMLCISLARCDETYESRSSSSTTKTSKIDYGTKDDEESSTSSRPQNKVGLSLDSSNVSEKTYGSTNRVAIADLRTSTGQLNISDSGVIDSLKISVDIKHTYIGDLIVSLVHPDGTTAVLHNRLGGGTDNILKTYETSVFANKTVNGMWKLLVDDRAAADTGFLESFSLIVQTVNVIPGPPIDPSNEVMTIVGTADDRILDRMTLEKEVTSNSEGAIDKIGVKLDLTHTYIGDLLINLKHPDGTIIILHNLSDGSTDNIHKTYGQGGLPLPDLSRLEGKPIKGTWKISIQDKADRDVGFLENLVITVYKKINLPVPEAILTESFVGNEVIADEGPATIKTFTISSVNKV